MLLLVCQWLGSCDGSHRYINSSRRSAHLAAAAMEVPVWLPCGRPRRTWQLLLPLCYATSAPHCCCCFYSCCCSCRRSCCLIARQELLHNRLQCLEHTLSVATCHNCRIEQRATVWWRRRAKQRCSRCCTAPAARKERSQWFGELKQHNTDQSRMAQHTPIHTLVQTHTYTYTACAVRRLLRLKRLSN